MGKGRSAGGAIKVTGSKAQGVPGAGVKWSTATMLESMGHHDPTYDVMSATSCWEYAFDYAEEILI